NTAALLESNERVGENLISEATSNESVDRYKLKAREPIMVKNREQPVRLYEVDWQRASGAL
ncbi:MAG: hypothetical protein ACREBG_23210, partial [Pyrinomonadaceae bacterium]